MRDATEFLNHIVDAWEALPGGRQVRNSDVERWLADDMAPAINAIRGFLRRPRPDGVLPPPPETNVAVADLVERAFEIGFCWRSQLMLQNVEDSRAVGRTLQSYLFDGLDIETRDYPSFESGDHGIVEAKKRIIKALRALATTEGAR